MKPREVYTDGNSVLQNAGTCLRTNTQIKLSSLSLTHIMYISVFLWWRNERPLLTEAYFSLIDLYIEKMFIYATVVTVKVSGSLFIVEICKYGLGNPDLSISSLIL